MAQGAAKDGLGQGQSRDVTGDFATWRVVRSQPLCPDVLGQVPKQDSSQNQRGSP